MNIWRRPAGSRSVKAIRPFLTGELSAALLSIAGIKASAIIRISTWMPVTVKPMDAEGTRKNRCDVLALNGALGGGGMFDGDEVILEG